MGHGSSLHGGHILSYSKHFSCFSPTRPAEEELATAEELSIAEELSMVAELSMDEELSSFFSSGSVLDDELSDVANELDIAAELLTVESWLLLDSGSHGQVAGEVLLLSQALKARATIDAAANPQTILDTFFFMMFPLISPIHFP